MEALKVCVTAFERNLEAQLDPRFGRCKYFIIIDPETLEFEAIENVAANALHGAGVQAAQIVISKGVEAIITGSIGPNAYQVLTAAGIRVITGVTGSIREVIERYRKGDLQSVTAPTVPAHYGMGIGRRMGFRRGVQSRGRNLSMRAGPPTALSTPLRGSPPPYPSKPWKLEEELAALEEYKKKLEEDLEGIEARIKELKESKNNAKKS